MIRAVFWDNDGVLVDTEKLYFQATRELLLRAGVTLTEPLFKRISLLEGRSAFDLATEKGLPQAEIDQLHEERNRRYTELLNGGIRILDGVQEALGALRGRALMGIVTSSRKVHFDAIHSGTGLLPWFDFVLTREDYRLSKPNPEPYLLAVRKSGFDAEECVVIEDSERGLQSALAAGIRCLIVPNDLTRGGDFAGAWRILNSSREVPAEIRRIEALGG
ncbi:MAG: HAD family phosphatase [Proteobacteria bacterium]|nr:HAD family phosphatase [Pseudomonadota bacterium]MBU2226435.1 HAD family phosphatase [Pseudomonadota bacterium]MBU2260438.1 HAD family phosphatase [Pseudomonadota bacterium]